MDVNETLKEKGPFALCKRCLQLRLGVQGFLSSSQRTLGDGVCLPGYS